jgi:hypothetical protein
VQALLTELSKFLKQIVSIIDTRVSQKIAFRQKQMSAKNG